MSTQGFAEHLTPGLTPERLTGGIMVCLLIGGLMSLVVNGVTPQAIALLAGTVVVAVIRRIITGWGYAYLSAWVNLVGGFLLIVYVTFTGYGPSAPAAIGFPTVVVFGFLSGGRKLGNALAVLSLAVVGALLVADKLGTVFPRDAADGVHGSIQLVTVSLALIMTWAVLWSLDRAWVAAQAQHRRQVGELALLYQQMQQARDEALRANDTKTRFLASMSHELRTPLNAIIGYSELLLDEEPEQLGLEDDLNRIRSSAVHLLALVGDVLDMSKVDADVLEITPKPCDLGGLGRNALNRVRALASKGVQCRVQVSGEVEVFADPARVRQIVDNLLVNAIRYATTFVEVRVDVDADGPYLLVQDDGAGMDETMMLRCFLPFEKGENSVGGTGLGLAIAHRLARLMHGELSVVSADGEGATFRLRLPTEQPAS